MTLEHKYLYRIKENKIIREGMIYLPKKDEQWAWRVILDDHPKSTILEVTYVT